MKSSCAEKVRLADQFARALGFNGLDDRQSIIGKPDLVAGMSDIVRFHEMLVRHFRKTITKRLRSKVGEPNDCVALLRCILRDESIDMGLVTRKYNRRIKGRQTAIYKYHLLGR